jgi:hypothetical protein
MSQVTPSKMDNLLRRAGGGDRRRVRGMGRRLAEFTERGFEAARMETSPRRRHPKAAIYLISSKMALEALTNKASPLARQAQTLAPPAPPIR